MMMIIYCGTTVGCLSEERTPCAPIGNSVVSDSIWVMRTVHTLSVCSTAIAKHRCVAYYCCCVNVMPTSNHIN